jgi:aldehyde:ferredoxin oxidoreductase
MDLWNGRILVVDLEKNETEEKDLEEEFIKENVGGACATQAMLEEGDFIIGTGLFTATLFPASCAGILTAQIDNRTLHSHFTWFSGAELKLSGFDFLILRGRSESPVYLWLRDELCDVNPADDLWGKDTWQTTSWLRNELGDPRIQVLCIGPAGEKMISYAQISNCYWGSEDTHGFARILGEKKVKAIAMRGMGELTVADPDGFIGKLKEIFALVKARKGYDEIVASLGKDLQIRNMVHRYDSCFSCPIACRTFVKYREPPTKMELSEEKEPGVLISDLGGLLSLLKNLTPGEAVQALQLCYKYGVDPAVGCNVKDKSEVESLAEEEKKLEKKHWDVEWDHGRFSHHIPPVGEREDWKRKVALSYILGVCPIFMLTTHIELSRIVELINLGTGWEISEEDVGRVINKMV